MDFVAIPKSPFALLYFWGGFVSWTAALLVIGLCYGRHNKTVERIINLQLLDIGVHAGGLMLKALYVDTELELFGLLHLIYTPALRVILVLKLIVLGTSGYDILRRKRQRDSRFIYPPAIRVSASYSAEKSENN